MDFTTSSAPWFFVAGLAGSFTVLGGLISIFGGYLNDLVKSRRERKRRWEAKIIDSVATLSSMGQQLILLKKELAQIESGQWADAVGGDRDKRKGEVLRNLLASTANMHTEVTRIEYIAPARVSKACNSYTNITIRSVSASTFDPELVEALRVDAYRQVSVEMRRYLQVGAIEKITPSWSALMFWKSR